MTSEVQHIIALSLNKIMASRSRRGGVSLHRNLLVASVLLRAKDAYIAETVAKRKRDMDAEAVVPNLECTVAMGMEPLPGSVESVDSNLPASTESAESTESSDAFGDNIGDTQIEEEEFHCSSSEDKPEPIEDNMDSFCDASKENVDPNVLSDCPCRASRKRRLNEMDSDVVEYKNINHESVSDLSCDENSLCNAEYEPNCKYIKMDNQYKFVYQSNPLDYSVSSEHCNAGYVLQTDSNSNWDYGNNKASNDNTNCLQSVYSSQISDQSQTFTQVGLSHTNLLIATV